VVSASVVASVSSFFILQNADIFRSLHGGCDGDSRKAKSENSFEDEPNRPGSPTLATKVQEALSKLETAQVLLIGLLIDRG
jgi:hypothetical protein